MLESNYVAFWIDNLIFFGCVLNRVVCPSLPWTSFSRSTSPCMCRRIPPEHTQTKWKCTSSFCGLPSSLLLSYTPFEFFRKAALQRLPVSSFPSALVSSIFSSRFTLAVRLSKPFRCLWTKLSLCVMALRTGIKDKRRLVEPLYWLLKAAGPPRCVVVQSRCSLSTKKIRLQI